MRERLPRIALLLLLMVAAVGGHRVYSRNYSQQIELVPLELDETDPKRKKVGALTFLNAWELRSDNSDFGGISALAVIGDSRFLAVSDAGTLIGFTLGKSDRMEDSFIAVLPGAYGENVDYRDRDSEGMTYDATSGQIWISYEARHAVRRLSPSLGRIDGTKRLTFTKGWKANGGIEAIARLRDGRFVLFSETHQRADGSNSAYIYSGDPIEAGSQPKQFGYRAPEGYRPTDATTLPDGRLLILNRRIGLPDGFSAKLALLDPVAIAADKAIAPQVIATLASPLLVDNMEGLAITHEDGRIIVWMISDNNFTALQRTILMQFALDLPNKKPEAETAPGFETLTK
ncbi:esterase-like activity of phytase family protein [Sphingorhabdus pulchriflava]|uniref:Esterase-like activity of phytase family protein n=1 Tax=Sphingorhabdus pulchriflava TaxID=2292257 RepID=A0A371BIB6_9SPHN|nr:esterase-like activity of phytase family protein [Sphingorhabdus pulchriflava]RDV07288.1 esterase-like activity of phytase family protein [Sphingorhabdus pulchriflava]